MDLHGSDETGDMLERALREAAGRDFDRAVARGIRYKAEQIVSLILDGRSSRAEIAQEIGTLRADVLEIFPERGDLFDAIYLARFKRLWAQFRPKEEPL